jgi:hypothetical protein
VDSEEFRPMLERIFDTDTGIHRGHGLGERHRARGTAMIGA